MDTNHYTDLTTQLETIFERSPRNSESAHRKTMETALSAVRSSQLSDDDKNSLISTIKNSANPSGWYYENSGIKAALNAIPVLSDASATKEAAEAEKATIDAINAINAMDAMDAMDGLNLANFQNLVSNGAIFSVQFIKRSTGEVRNMTCRTGVKKHLKGGTKAYDPKTHNLLTVFDMVKKAYRSIPADAIQRLTVNGQSFSLAGVES